MTTHDNPMIGSSTSSSNASDSKNSRSPINRRDFLKGAGVFTLTLALGIDLAARTQAVAAITQGKVGATLPAEMQARRDTVVTLNAWLKIAADGAITLAIPKADMGQGVRTSIAMLVAEELDADWGKMQVEQAIADGVYGNMLTAGSSSIAQLFTPMRLVGATARTMLISAAAQSWGISADRCRAEQGVVIADDGRTLSYGDLAATAATLPVPPRFQVKLKDLADFKLIGKPTERIDNPDVVSGRTRYGIDVRLPGLLFAMVARPPVFGGKVTSVDDTAARAVPGVKAVVQIGSGVAVVGENTWAAQAGRDALQITWDDGQHATLNSTALRDQLRNAPTTFNEDPAGLVKTLESTYELPYLAHAPMEPLNATAHIQGDKAELWVPTQSPDGVQRMVSQRTGLPANAITVHTTLLGGGFGRKVEMDYVREAVEASQAVSAPVQVIWTRADDMRHGAYRPASVHILRAGLNANGQVEGWQHRIHTQALSNAPAFLAGILGASGTRPPYKMRVGNPILRTLDLPVTTGFWRSVYLSQNIFAVESFVDELAALAGQDPFEFRLSMVNEERVRGVLELAAAKADWGKPLPAGRARGIACMADLGSFIAQVVELSVNADGSVRVHRVVSAVDCGVTVNPKTVEAQIQGGVVDGLSTAFKAEITIEGGRVQQSSFRDFEWYRMRDMPESIEVYIVPSTDAPGGIGEVGYPCVPPAVASAIFAATGKRLRKLPIRPADIMGA